MFKLSMIFIWILLLLNSLLIQSNQQDGNTVSSKGFNSTKTVQRQPTIVTSNGLQPDDQADINGLIV